jgi:hypothetical protein
LPAEKQLQFKEHKE